MVLKKLNIGLDYLFLCGCLFTLQNCSPQNEVNCPASENIGELELREESLEFAPYLGNEELTFINSDNEEVVLTSEGLLPFDNRLYAVAKCEDSSTPLGFVFDYYEGEYRNLSFRNIEEGVIVNVLLRVFFNGIATLEKPSYLFDFLTINFQKDLANTEISHVVSDREHNDDSEFQLVVEEINDGFNLLGDIKLLDRSFNEVYASAEGDLRFYYNSEFGLVAYEYDDLLFVLKE